jgi:hypothetical protein
MTGHTYTAPAATRKGGLVTRTLAKVNNSSLELGQFSSDNTAAAGETTGEI